MRCLGVRIEAPSRAHFGLISLTADSSCSYGGLGLALQHYRAVIEAEYRPKSELRISGMPDEMERYVSDRLNRLNVSSLHLRVHQAPPQHVGLGSKTAVVLACVEAALLVQPLRSPPSADEIVVASGRGGASGVGVNTYFMGGLVADGGHRCGDSGKFVPSSGRNPTAPPAPILRMEWPTDWQVVLLRPEQRFGPHGANEVSFFRNNTPVGRTECAEVAMALLLELPSAVLSQDFAAMKSSLARSRRHGLKAAEIRLYPEVLSLLQILDELEGVAATMSSIGPSVVCIIDAKSPFPFATLQHQAGLSDWIITPGAVANHGRIVTCR